MNGYRIERLTESSLFNLVKLYKDCFNLKVDLEFLKLKYNTRVFGAEYIGFLAFAEESQEPVAYYGVFPIVCKSEKTEFLAALSGDTMTHPQHQGLGLFIHLANLTYALAKTLGVSFVFGFPNKNSYPGFIKKLNWVHCSDIYNYKINSGALPFDKLAKKSRLINFFYSSFVRRRLSGILVTEQLENSASVFYPTATSVLHDERFFKYKAYFDHYVVKINEKRVVLRVDGRLWIGDVESCTETEFRQLVKSLLNLAKKLACSSVQFSLSKELQYNTYLRSYSKVIAENPVGLKMLEESMSQPNLIFTAFDFDTF